MIKISGMGQLEHYGKRLRSLPGQWPKAQASAANKAAAEVKKATKKDAATKTGLPSQPVGKRIWVKRADARRKSQLWSRVTAGLRKFSASYHKRPRGGSGGSLMARELKRGVKVGRNLLPGAWVGRSKRRGREFVGKRTSALRESAMYPSFDIGSVLDRSIKRNGDRIGSTALEKELARQVERRTKKHLVGL